MSHRVERSSGRTSNRSERGSDRPMGNRYNPYDRPAHRESNERPRERQREPDELPSDGPLNSIKVAGNMDAREISRIICEASRRGEELPTLMTIGFNSVNQAVKGIAVARAEMRMEDTDIAFQPAFRHEDRTRPLIAFYLTKRRPSSRDEGAAELTVGSQSKIIAVAGAISGRIREGQRVYLSAIGVNAVGTSVLSCANGRLFLETDSKDIKVQPEFIKVMKGESEFSGIRFNLIVESI